MGYRTKLGLGIVGVLALSAAVAFAQPGGGMGRGMMGGGMGMGGRGGPGMMGGGVMDRWQPLPDRYRK